MAREPAEPSAPPSDVSAAALAEREAAATALQNHVAALEYRVSAASAELLNRQLALEEVTHLLAKYRAEVHSLRLRTTAPPETAGGAGRNPPPFSDSTRTHSSHPESLSQLTAETPPTCLQDTSQFSAYPPPQAAPSPDQDPPADLPRLQRALQESEASRRQLLETVATTQALYDQMKADKNAYTASLQGQMQRLTAALALQTAEREAERKWILQQTEADFRRLCERQAQLAGEVQRLKCLASAEPIVDDLAVLNKYREYLQGHRSGEAYQDQAFDD